MSEDLNERLLRAIVAAGHSSEHDLDRERALDRLDEYVERELAGEDVIAILPEIAFLIMVDPEIQHAYTELRQLLADFPAELPDVPFDMIVMASRLGQTTILLPDDIVRSMSSQQNIPIDIVTTLIPVWQRHLPRFSLTFKDASTPETAPMIVSVPDQAEATQLEIIITRTNTGYELSGRVQPSRDELVGRPVYLYRLVLDPTTAVTLIGEYTINDFDRFLVPTIPAGVYVLALIINDKVIGTAWFDLQSGRS